MALLQAAGIMLLLFLPVSAVNDINITFDGKNDLCVTSNFINQTCNTSQVLVLSGTDDHFLYFAPKTYIETDMSTSDKITAIVGNPLMMLSGFGVLLLVVGFGFLFTHFIMAVGGRR